MTIIVINYLLREPLGEYHKISYNFILSKILNFNFNIVMLGLWAKFDYCLSIFNISQFIYHLKNAL